MKNFIALFLSLVACFSCDNDAAIRKKFKTKDENRCRILLNRDDFLRENLFFLNKFNNYIKARKNIYAAPAYRNQPEVFIDTILFSSDRNNAAIFVISKCYSKMENDYVYDGVVHFAGKIKDSVENNRQWRIYVNHGALHINGETYEKISGILRVNNFVYRSYAAFKNNEEGYNLDDCRFWTNGEFARDIQAGGFEIMPDDTLDLVRPIVFIFSNKR